jgi:AcrR family transcriptional regulator
VSTRFHESSGRRPSSRPLTDRQRRILEAATQVFAERGFEGAATAEIAQRAEVSEGTMFKRFRTKKDLLLAVTGPYLLEIGAPDLAPVLESALADENPGLERLLHAIIRDRIEFARKHPAVIRILVQEAPFHPEILDGLSGIGSRMFALIERFQRTGEIDRGLRPATVARLIFSAILSHLLARVFVRLREDDEARSIDETVQVLVRGLAPARLQQGGTRHDPDFKRTKRDPDQRADARRPRDGGWQGRDPR